MKSVEQVEDRLQDIEASIIRLITAENVEEKQKAKEHYHKLFKDTYKHYPIAATDVQIYANYVKSTYNQYYEEYRIDIELEKYRKGFIKTHNRLSY